MNPIVRNILAVIAGLFVGSIVNMGLILASGYIVPYPEGYDFNRFEETFHLLESKHMIMPWFAHAMGTLAGAFVATKIAAYRHLAMAMLIGIFFLLGGWRMMTLVPQPTWFSIIDLGLAYIPMAMLGWKLAGSPRGI